MKPGILLLCALVSAWAADPVRPCTRADASCTEHIPLGPSGRFSVVYRSFAVTKKNPAIERALIVIHGAGRNADSYFGSGIASALLAGTLESTIVIAPRIASNHGSGCNDQLSPGEISWICGGENDWRRGGAADGLSNVFTYTLVDQVIRKLGNKEVFPNLRVIVVTGHSAGGQFTNRYAAATRIDAEVKTPIHYVVANPSSYLYLDAMRLPPGASCDDSGACSTTFQEYSGAGECAAYNRWHYGLENRAAYAASLSDAELRNNLIRRRVTYLLGELDTLPLFGFDSSCSAMAQGPSRFQRGLNYWNYLHSRYAANHKLVTVDDCGHNGRCMYTSPAALPVIFPAR